MPKSKVAGMEKYYIMVIEKSFSFLIFAVKGTKSLGKW